MRGRELAVTVLGPADAPEVLPVIEIETDEPFYTFRAHYDPGAATMREAELDDGVRERVERVAADGLPAAGCRDLGRVDLILDESGTPQILEINTIPGLTETGPTRYAAQAAGMDFTGPDRARDLARHGRGVMRRAMASPSRAPASTSRRVVDAEIRARQRHRGRDGVERRARKPGRGERAGAGERGRRVRGGIRAPRQHRRQRGQLLLEHRPRAAHGVLDDRVRERA